jgi:hypothetical protein
MYCHKSLCSKHLHRRGPAALALSPYVVSTYVDYCSVHIDSVHTYLVYTYTHTNARS